MKISNGVFILVLILALPKPTLFQMPVIDRDVNGYDMGLSGDFFIIILF
jgi:hypothetical protein